MKQRERMEKRENEQNSEWEKMTLLIPEFYKETNLCRKKRIKTKFFMHLGFRLFLRKYLYMKVWV